MIKNNGTIYHVNEKDLKYHCTSDDQDYKFDDLSFILFCEVLNGKLDSLKVTENMHKILCALKCDFLLAVFYMKIKSLIYYYVEDYTKSGRDRSELEGDISPFIMELIATDKELRSSSDFIYVLPSTLGPKSSFLVNFHRAMNTESISKGDKQLILEGWNNYWKDHEDDLKEIYSQFDIENTGCCEEKAPYDDIIKKLTT